MSTTIQWRDMQHSAAQLDAAVDTVNAHTADTAVHMSAAEKEKLAALENYDDTEIRQDLAAKQDALTFDSTPTSGSDNPVKSGGVKTYVDTAVSGLIGINDVYGLGTTIPDNADIDADPYLTPGVHIRTSNQNSSIHGIPVNGYAFKLIVEYINSNIRRRQIFIPLSATAEYYIRIYNSGGWQAWYKFEGTAVTPPAANSVQSALRPDVIREETDDA